MTSQASDHDEGVLVLIAMSTTKARCPHKHDLPCLSDVAFCYRLRVFSFGIGCSLSSHYLCQILEEKKARPKCGAQRRRHLT